ncbi:MAG TPA: PAS domain S-box protein [Dermatophilaceae bacterium]
MPLQETTSLESLLDVVPDALVGVDRAGVIRCVNRQTESLFGYDHGDLVGQPLETLVPESLREVHATQREAYFQNPETRHLGSGLELSGRRRDGTQFPVDVSLSHIDTENGPLVIAAVRDMAERKKAEDDRRLSNRMAAIIEHSNEAIVSVALDGIVASWNPAAERMYGYSSEEIVGQSVGVTNPHDRAGESIAIMARIRAGQPVERLETTRVRKDGTVFPISLTISPIRDKDGAITGASAIVSDVTEQRQAFGSARSMIESSLDSLVAISPEGMITDVNDATVTVTGIPREELIGTAFSECFTDPEKANAIYQLVFEQGMAVDYPLTMRRRDGTLTEVLYNASVYRDAGGKVLGVFAAARDVTKQRQAGAQYARSLIEAGLDPLVAISPEGKITDVNEATVKVTGVAREELIGTAFSDYFTEPEKANEGYQRAFAQGSVTDYPLTLRHPDGTLTEVLYNASVYRDAGGKVLGVFAAARDVTEQKQAQAAIAQQAKELDRLAELERFQRLTVGRELKMIELKKEIESLRRFVPREGGELDD